MGIAFFNPQGNLWGRYNYSNWQWQKRRHGEMKFVAQGHIVSGTAGIQRQAAPLHMLKLPSLQHCTPALSSPLQKGEHVCFPPSTFSGPSPEEARLPRGGAGMGVRDRGSYTGGGMYSVPWGNRSGSAPAGEEEERRNPSKGTLTTIKEKGPRTTKLMLGAEVQISVHFFGNRNRKYTLHAIKWDHICHLPSSSWSLPHYKYIYQRAKVNTSF